MGILRQVHKGRLLALAGVLAAFVGGALATYTTHPHQQMATSSLSPTLQPAVRAQLGVLHGPTAPHNPYGLPYRNTAAGRVAPPHSYGADAVYFPTEKGRHVVCLAHNLGYYGAVMSCDWAGYHARYGPGDPFDQR